MKLTQERLKEVLSYDPETGVFVRKITANNNKAKKGDLAGHLNKIGYLEMKVDGKRYYAHRLAWLYVNGYFPELNIDHINRKRNDNRIKNLREASQQCNVRNAKMKSSNKSGITGVCWYKPSKKWKAQITSGTTINLGHFKDFNDAVKARWCAEKKYNYPNCCTTSSSYNYLKERELI